MIFFVSYGDKEETIRVECRNQKMLVKVGDGPEEPVDLAYIGNDCSFVYKNQIFSANVAGGKGDYTVWRPQGNLQFKVESEYRRIVGKLRGQDLDQENNVFAKMPGKIAKISVKVGDVVQKGAPLLVMEAMKMENEIRSTTNGKVSNICVKEGQAVESGALLVELTPEEE